MNLKIRFRNETEVFKMNSWCKSLGTVMEKVKECKNWELNNFKLFYITAWDHKLEISNQSDYDNVLEMNEGEDLEFEVIEFDDDFMTISDVFTQVRNIRSSSEKSQEELSTERPDNNNNQQSVYEIQVFDNKSISYAIPQQNQGNRIWETDADHLHQGNDIPNLIPSDFDYNEQNYGMQIKEAESNILPDNEEKQSTEVEQLKLLILSTKLMAEKMDEMSSKALTKDEFNQGMEAVNTKVASLEGYKDKIDTMMVKVENMSETIEYLKNNENNKDTQKDILNRLKKLEKLIKDKKEGNYQKELDNIKEEQQKQSKNRQIFYDDIKDKICDLQNDLLQINEDVNSSSKKIDKKLENTKKKMKKLVKNQEQLEASLNKKFKTSINNTIHHEVSCDECGIAEIKGIRYHCLICKDYDLCEQCERTKGHNHNMIKFVKETNYEYPILVDKNKLKIKGMTKKKQPKVDKEKLESFKTYIDAVVDGYDKEKKYYIERYSHLDLNDFLALLEENKNEWFPE